jgi:hypothetical protein
MTVIREATTVQDINHAGHSQLAGSNVVHHTAAWQSESLMPQPEHPLCYGSAVRLLAPPTLCQF